MKIGFLTKNIYPKDGGGRYAAELVARLKEQGYEIVVLSDAGENVPGSFLKRGFGMAGSALRAISFLKDCDIIHALDGYPYGVIGALANIFLRKKFIITVYGTYGVAPLYHRSTAWIMKWAYRQADKIIPISTYTGSEILKKIQLNNIEVINPGLDLKKFYQEHEESQEKFILGVGAAKERKGYHISIRAFAKIAHKFLDYKYYIVADDGRDFLTHIAQEEGVADRIVFFEGISDEKLLELYRRARLFILTPISTSSHHLEGYGLVYLEAAAAGTPVIGTFDTGAADAVDDGRNGILISQRDHGAAAEAMSKIISHDAVWKEMSIAGHLWAKKHDLHHEIQQYIQMYKNL